MPKKKDIVKAGAPVRFRENSRIMRAHETMVDIISGRTGGSFMDAFANGILGLDLLRGLDAELENEIIYSDEDDDDHFYPPMAPNKALEPHPRIRQLTDEEAERHAKELIEEEERRKDKTEKNKRKKMRKKQKKRLEKENAVKDILPEEEQGKSDSSENQEESSIIESNAEATESPESGETQNEPEVPESDESSEKNKEDGEQKDLNLNNSYASTAESAPEETRNQAPATETKKENSQLPEVQQPEEEKPKDVEKPEVQKKKEEKQETIKEKTMDPTVEEYAKRSRELAGVGNRLAASGQYGVAVKCFTDAIKYNPTEFKLFGNRSLCYERMQQYENALRDADLALSMEPNWVKGLFRKGKALCGLKRYYEASLVYKEVLKLDSTSLEATQELKRAQTLHLMEMGFSWAQSSQALKTHATLEEAVEALFASDGSRAFRDAGASRDNIEPPVVQQEVGEEEDGQWIVCGLQPSRPRAQQIKESDGFGQSRSNSLSPTPLSRSAAKPELHPIWVGSLAPAVTYATLHELFSRAGTVYSIKMLLEHQCAFVNYTRKEDCDRAIHCINGMVVEGAPLSVRYPNKIPLGLGMSKSAATEPSSRPGMFKKECFFWRTTGCTRQDCTYKHVPEHKNIDKDKFTSRLATNHV